MSNIYCTPIATLIGFCFNSYWLMITVGLLSRHILMVLLFSTCVHMVFVVLSRVLHVCTRCGGCCILTLLAV